jgi:Na+/serine symporter
MECPLPTPLQTLAPYVRLVEVLLKSIILLAVSLGFLVVFYRARATYFPAATWRRDEQPILYWFGMSFYALGVVVAVGAFVSSLR